MSRPSESRPVPAAEQVASLPTGIDLCYQTFGDPSGEPMLLVMGLGGPMTWWDPGFCTRLADEGFHVIRFDNRDSGRSSRLDGRINRRLLVQALLGVGARPPYTLRDMADDGFALLDHLGHDGAHVVGVSMGGMIAQTMAVSRPDQVRSLTSIMSSTGRRTVGWQNPRLLPMLLAKRAKSREHYIAAATRMASIIGSPEYPDTPEALRRRAEETWERGVDPAAVARQMAAIITQPDRSRALSQLTVPSLVIHGTRDRMVHVSGGRATSRAIPGAELMLLPGIGHDIPAALHDTFVEAIVRNAQRARSGSRTRQR